MSGYSYSFHRFDDRDGFLQACLDAGFQFHEGVPCPSEGDAIDDIGTLVDQESEDDLPVVLPGYHVNMAWKNDMNSAFAASEVFPQNPRRLWF
jgi:hypothetical protein